MRPNLSLPKLLISLIIILGSLIIIPSQTSACWLSLQVAPSYICADGETSTDVTATLKRQDGGPNGGHTVSFSIISGGGKLDPTSATTNDSGQATITYYQPTTPTPSIVTIYASVTITIKDKEGKEREVTFTAYGRVYIVEIGGINTSVKKACPGYPVTFTAITNPTGSEHLIRWSGGGNPKQGSGAIFTTKWGKKGDKIQTTKVVIACCNNTSVCKGKSVAIGYTKCASWEELQKCKDKVQDPFWEYVLDGCSTPTGDNPTRWIPPNIFCRHTSFLGACNTHDRCYQTCKSNKTKCDKQFYRNMKKVCNKLRGPERRLCGGKCKMWADIYHIAVDLVGDRAYQGDQVKACACCDGIK